MIPLCYHFSKPASADLGLLQAVRDTVVSCKNLESALFLCLILLKFPPSGIVSAFPVLTIFCKTAGAFVRICIILILYPGGIYRTPKLVTRRCGQNRNCRITNGLSVFCTLRRSNSNGYIRRHRLFVCNKNHSNNTHVRNNKFVHISVGFWVLNASNKPIALFSISGNIHGHLRCVIKGNSARQVPCIRTVYAG